MWRPFRLDPACLRPSTSGLPWLGVGWGWYWQGGSRLPVGPPPLTLCLGFSHLSWRQWWILAGSRQEASRPVGRWRPASLVVRFPSLVLRRVIHRRRLGRFPSGSSLVVSSWWGRKRLGGGIGVSGFLRMRAAAMGIMVSYSRFSVTSSSAYRCSSLRSVVGLRLG